MPLLAMPVLIGAGLACVVSLFATGLGLDRDKAFYPTVTIVVASYYALFAVVGGASALTSESVVFLLFLAAAAVGFKQSLWIVAGALCAHGVFDFFHGQWIANPGVPVWWPSFCAAYDVTAGAYLAFLLTRLRSVAGR